MPKKQILVLALLLSTTTTFAQRLSLPEFLKLVQTSLQPSKTKLIDINALLRDNSEDWGKPSGRQADNEYTVTWPYTVDNAQLGFFEFTTSLDKKAFQKATFAFIYRDQYESYLKVVKANAAFMNSFTSKGTIHNVYDSKRYTWVFIKVPAAAKQLYMDGKPIEEYLVEVQNKL